MEIWTISGYHFECILHLKDHLIQRKRYYVRGAGEIAQSLASLSIKWAIRVRARYDPLVIERWNSITISHQCRRLVKKRPSMCYYVCVMMHVKDP